MEKTEQFLLKRMLYCLESGQELLSALAGFQELSDSIVGLAREHEIKTLHNTNVE